MDRAVALDEADHAVGADERLREIALLVLDDGELARTIDERRVGRQSIGQPLAHAVEGAPSSFLEHAVDQGVAADRVDGREQPAGQGVVVGREEVLGGIGHVVDVARPADTVADRLAADEPGRSPARGAAAGPPSG